MILKAISAVVCFFYLMFSVYGCSYRTGVITEQYKFDVHTEKSKVHDYVNTKMKKENCVYTVLQDNTVVEKCHYQNLDHWFVTQTALIVTGVLIILGLCIFIGFQAKED